MHVLLDSKSIRSYIPPSLRLRRRLDVLGRLTYVFRSSPLRSPARGIAVRKTAAREIPPSLICRLSLTEGQTCPFYWAPSQAILMRSPLLLAAILASALTLCARLSSHVPNSHHTSRPGFPLAMGKAGASGKVQRGVDHNPAIAVGFSTRSPVSLAECGVGA